MVKRMITPMLLFVFGIAVAGWLPMPLVSSVALAEDDTLANKLNLSLYGYCLLYTSPSPRDRTRSRMPSSA